MKPKDLIEAIRERLKLDWDTMTGNGAVWLKKSEQRQTQIVHFTTIKTLKGISVVGALTGYKSFPEVEDIMKKYYKKYCLKDPLYTIQFQSSRNDRISGISLEKPDDVDKVASELQTMFGECLAFFEAYKHVEQVNKKMQSLSFSDTGSFMYHPTSVRIMIIKRLAGTGDFEEFSDETIKFYKQHSAGPHKAQIAPYYQFLPELFEELKSMEVK